MKTKTIRTATCLHCHQEYIMAKNTQKFCVTSCRSSWHRMNKRKNAPRPPKISGQNLDGISELQKSTPIKDFLMDATAASIPILINEFIKSGSNVNNRDLMKVLNTILTNQIVFHQEIKNKFDLFEKEIKKLNSDKNAFDFLNYQLLN